MPPGGNITQPLIILLGPTAVGKTTLSIELAEAIDGEIISADSRLIYRGMDIGVAKPTPEQQARVPHHMLDLVAPDEILSLAGYQRLAYDAIDSTLDRGHVPLLVGGTGQYITALIEGWSIPEVSPNAALRDELEMFAEQQGPAALHDRLQAVDPQAAQNIHPNNVRRVVRALEVYLETGTPISELQRKKPPPYKIFQVGLTRPREALHQRIDQRIDQMLADGLLAEVHGLLKMGYARTLPAMTGLGYAQLSAYLHGETTLPEAIEAIRRETRDFARRQEVWFRKYNRAAHWFDLSRTATAQIVAAVRDWLESETHATN